MKVASDLKSINPRYKGLSIGEIARMVFKPKHDRFPIAKQGEKKPKDSKERE